MKFEFDANKSTINAEKHGIDFVQVQAVWADDRTISIRSRETPELRFLAIGRIGKVFWSASGPKGVRIRELFPRGGRGQTRWNSMKTQDFDDAFEAGVDMIPLLDLTSIRKLKQDAKHVNVAFPAWMVQGLDREATRLGVTRQSLIKMWIAEKLG